jgi:cytochrome c oxidase assembly protein subunit 15
MGCPDWPKCFGQYIPPTSADELPADYEAQFREKRLVKNTRLAGMLDRIGMTAQAESLRQANPADIPTEFNVTQTWIEYLNRLVGVVIGLLIIATFFYSLKLRQYNPRISLFAALALVLVIFQGWLGSIVVSSNLLPGMVTVHMLPALLLVCFLIYVFVLAGNFKLVPATSAIKWSVIAAGVITLVQIVLGTQVREEVDMLYWAGVDRADWISGLGNDFIVHRSFSWLVLAAHVLIFVLAKKYCNPRLKQLTVWALALVGVMGISGIALAYFGFPPAMQPLHLLLGTALFGLQYFIYLKLSRSAVNTIVPAIA